MPKIKSYNPIICEKTANGEEMYDVYSRLMKERILFLGEIIDNDTANSIVSQMLWLDSQNQKPIHMYINSDGGSISAMFAIYDIMQFIKSPIYTFVLGTAASAAAVLLSAGQKGFRHALPNSEMMIHQPWADGIGGDATNIDIMARQLKHNKKQLISVLARHVEKTYEEVEKVCERDSWFSPTQAMKFGIVDKICEPKKVIPELVASNNYHRSRKR